VSGFVDIISMPKVILKTFAMKEPSVERAVPALPLYIALWADMVEKESSVGPMRATFPIKLA
jgi:hypothetical protein